MPQIEVERIVFSNIFSRPRVLTISIGERTVPFRIRPCSNNSTDVPRLTIVTSTRQHLPRTRRVEQVTVRSGRMPKSSLFAVTLYFGGELRMHVEDEPSHDDKQIGPRCLDLLDQVLPEYRFV